MKSLQADFFKVMKEGAIQYAAPLPFLDLICVGTATQTCLLYTSPSPRDCS